MSSVYTYPHTSVTVTAKQRRKATVAESTATTLLAPFTCDRGPENELVAIDNMSDFISTYGELDYSIPDQRQILNIGNWLTNGGRVLALRLTDINYKNYDSAYSSVTATKAQRVLFYNTKRSLYVEATVTAETTVVTDGTYYVKISGTYTLLTEAHKDTEYADSNGKAKTGITYYTYSESYSINKITGSYSSTIKGDTIYTGEYEYTTAIIVTAKYSGTYYNNIELDLEFSTSSAGYFDFVVYEVNNGVKTAVERYRNKTFKTIQEAVINSNYIGSIEFKRCVNTSVTDFTKWQAIETFISELDPSGTEYTERLLETTIYTNAFLTLGSMSFIVTGSTAVQTGDITAGVDVGTNFLSTKCTGTENTKTWMCQLLKMILEQPLTTPFNCMIDCGYIVDVKKDLCEVFTKGWTIQATVGTKTYSVTQNRKDAYLFLSDYEIKGDGRKNYSNYISEISSADLLTMYGSGYYNHCFMHGYGKMTDLYSADSGKQVYVAATTPCYAAKVCYNDAQYGVHKINAGKTRGKVNNLLWLSYNLTNPEKQKYYDAQINYIEKDSTGNYIMTDLTADTDDTPVKFINNARSVLVITKELQEIARQYIHEFMDSTTLTSLENKLNASLGAWTAKNVDWYTVSLETWEDNDSLRNEELLVKASVRFKDHIECIPIEFTVEA